MKIFTKKNVAAAIKDVEREEAKRKRKKTPKMTKEQIATVLGDDKALTREWMSHATYLILKEFLEKEQARFHEEFVNASYMIGDYKWDKSGTQPKLVKTPKWAGEANECLHKFFRQ